MYKRQIVVGLLADGHLLLESLPGLAKTRTVRALASNLDARMSRIQFTPDLLPSDITGADVLQADGAGGHRIQFQQGPLFGNIILADEINRAPAKVQSALLEAMEERQVTVGGATRPMPALFMVVATQNPIEQEGTYPLPEAQMDRFLMKIRLDLSLIHIYASTAADPERLRSSPPWPRRLPIFMASNSSRKNGKRLGQGGDERSRSGSAAVEA